MSDFEEFKKKVGRGIAGASGMAEANSAAIKRLEEKLDKKINDLSEENDSLKNQMNDLKTNIPQNLRERFAIVEAAVIGKPTNIQVLELNSAQGIGRDKSQAAKWAMIASVAAALIAAIASLIIHLVQ